MHLFGNPAGKPVFGCVKGRVDRKINRKKYEFSLDEGYFCTRFSAFWTIGFYSFLLKSYSGEGIANVHKQNENPKNPGLCVDFEPCARFHCFSRDEETCREVNRTYFRTSRLK